MPYFSSKDIAVISISSAFWAIVNATISPIFWRLTHLPFLCDLLALISLSIAVWWSRRLGTATLVGIIATLLNFVLRPGALFFLGFTAAAIVFDVLTYALRYERLFSGMAGAVMVVIAGIFSTWIAGLIIGAFFMGFTTLLAIVTFSTLHATGGLLGAVIGVSIIKSVERRGVRP